MTGHPLFRRFIGTLGRLRLWIAVLAPMLAMVAFAVLVMRERLKEYQHNSDMLVVAQVARASRSLVRELESERSLSAQFIGSSHAQWKPILLEQRSRVDERVSDYRRMLLRPKMRALNAASQWSFPTEALDTARATVDGSGDLRQVLDDYSRLVVATTRSPTAMNTPTLPDLIAAYMDLGSLKDRVERSRTLGASLLLRGPGDPDLIGLFAEARAEQNAFTESFRNHAAPAQARLFDEVVRGPVLSEIERLHRLTLSGRLTGVESESWHRSHAALLELIDRAETKLATSVEASIQAELNHAQTNFYLALAGIVAVVAFSLETLRRSERRAVLWEEEARKLFRAVEQSPVSVMITDTTGTIEYTNPAFTRMTGFERSEAVGRNPRMLRSEQMAPRTYDDLWRTIRAGAEWRGELVNRRKDGSLYWEKMTIAPVKGPAGAIDSYIALKEDVTEVHTLRQALEHEHANLRRILGSIRDGIALVSADGFFEYANPALDEVFGPTAGRTARDCLGAELPCTGEWQPPGSAKTYDVTVAPVRNPDGSVSMLAAFHDITLRKQAEAAIVEAREAAELADRAKSEFLATMSHELRTPLNAIIGFSEIIENQLLGPLGLPQYGEYAHDINESGRHLLQIINDILDIARMEVGRIILREERIDTFAALQSCLGLVRERADAAHVALVTPLPDSLPDLWGDPRRIKQAVVNILSNAIKFTPAGGRVTLSAEAGPDGMTFAIKDTGIGIDPQTLPKVLAPFGQADSSLARRFDGAGLGLPLARKLMDLHGGSLTIASEPAKGTLVTLHFPAERLR
jgi:PAS domain S-box-containing protein